jgi:hypothetical protein
MGYHVRNRSIVLGFRGRALPAGLAVIGASLALAGASPSASVTGTRMPFTVQAGRNFQSLGRLELRRTRHAVTYADAIAVFGKPSSCRLHGYPAAALARWRPIGVRLHLATLGGLPPGKNGCNAPRLIHIDSAIASDSRWHTRAGLQIGATVADLKGLYPKATFQRRPIGNWPAPAYWIVHVRERCVIGICRSRYVEVPRLIAHVIAGHVAEFFFPVGAQGE